MNNFICRFQELLYEGVNVDVIHADRPQGKRDEVVRNFRQGVTWVLICTDLMGRGIDFKGVNLVINYDFPQSVISYIHRIGRTGRAGKNGAAAITSFTQVPSFACWPFSHVISHVTFTSCLHTEWGLLRNNSLLYSGD